MASRHNLWERSVFVLIPWTFTDYSHWFSGVGNCYLAFAGQQGAQEGRGITESEAKSNPKSNPKSIWEIWKSVMEKGDGSIY